MSEETNAYRYFDYSTLFKTWALLKSCLREAKDENNKKTILEGIEKVEREIDRRYHEEFLRRRSIDIFGVKKEIQR